MDGAIDAVEQATLAYHRGEVRDGTLTDKTAAADPNILQITLAAHDTVVSGFQLFAEIYDGPAVPNARFVTLLDPTTRALLAIVDYWSLSPVRVGASGGVAARYLAPAGARVVGVLGSAGQARGQLWAICRGTPSIERAQVFSPTRANREAFAQETADFLGIDVVAVDAAEQAVRDADVLAIANNARGPVLEWGWVKPGALLVSISGGRLPAEVVSGARAVMTTWDQLATREPYAAAIKAGTYSRDHAVGDLASVILQQVQPRQRPEDIVSFELGRMSYWAVATAHWAYQWAVTQGTGTKFDLSS